MLIRIAQSAGFCPGVKKAVDTVRLLAKEKSTGRLFTLGRLIHNSHLVRELEDMGVRVIAKEDLPGLAASCGEKDPVTVVIRTHGVPKELQEQLRELADKTPGFRVIDCTCPFVAKIHRIADERTGEDAALVVFGDPGHPEVQGIVSFAKGDRFVCSDPGKALPDFLRNKPLTVVAQTTGKLSEWKKFKENIKKDCTNPIFFDTICSVTENRQRETALLAAECDLMLVVGGKESSNTRGLLTVAEGAGTAATGAAATGAAATGAAATCAATERNGRANSPAARARAFLIEAPEDLRHIPEALLRTAKTVGITAGASTPDSIIQEVYQHMSEIQTNENFAQLLDESFKTLNTGDIVKGIVTSVTPNELHVDLSAKVTGVVPFDEITDDSSVKLSDLYKVGDEVEAQAFRVSDVDGVATLSIKRIQKILNWRKIVEAKETGEILEGKVTEAVKGGVLVSCLFQRIFIPAAHSGVPRNGDLGSLRGTVVRFKIIDVEEGRNRAVGSIRAVLREERKARLAKFWEEIEVGKKYTGTVKSMTSYGAFVDLGGIDGMVHASELSWKRIKSPADVLSVGDEIEVFVKSFDPEKKRISLGYKTEATNPWNIFRSKYEVGDTATVTVVSLMPFGAFAEVVPGADGLIHVSQITDHKIATPAEVLQVGQVVNAKIVGIDEENKKISLSIRALMEEEAAESESDGEENGEDEVVVYSEQ